MSDLNGKIAVVTGAASGLGRALALQLSKEGCNLIAADYNKKELEETAKQVKAGGGQIAVFDFDVSDLSKVIKFSKDVKKKFGQIDILINNAGVTLWGKFDEMPIKDFEWIMGINLWGPVYMMQAFISDMKKRETFIVNISSTFGMAGAGSQSAYSATKFAIRGLTESIQNETRKFPVTVISVIPGGIKTNMFKNSRVVKEGQVIKDTSSYTARMEKFGRTTAQDAAAKIINAIKNKKTRVVIGPDAHIIDRLTRFLPNRYQDIMAKLF